MNTIFGDPVRYPRRRVRAFVGAFASDLLGDYPNPARAVQAARQGGYAVVHVMYRNGEADSVDVTIH